MSFYADLDPCDYFGAEHAARFKAVGWLSEGREFRRAKADPRFVHKLVLLLAEPNPLEPSSDPYFCEICAFCGNRCQLPSFVPPFGDRAVVRIANTSIGKLGTIT